MSTLLEYLSKEKINGYVPDTKTVLLCLSMKQLTYKQLADSNHA